TWLQIRWDMHRLQRPACTPMPIRPRAAPAICRN
ncbi:MAG: hypothetical protein AVDCRST_MAG93-5898, partial [uncultured Chloroflexia bacterium]